MKARSLWNALAGIDNRPRCKAASNGLGAHDISPMEDALAGLSCAGSRRT